MWRQRILLFIIFLCLVSLAYYFFSNKSQDLSYTKQEPTYGGVYRRAFADSFITLDPARIKDSNSHEVARQIFDGLVCFDGKGAIVPALCEDWTISEDKLTYVFRIRNNVKFHSNVCGRPTKNGGRKLTVLDVVYTFKRLLAPNDNFQNALYWVIKGAKDFTEQKSNDITGIRILDEQRVEFTLNSPFSPFVSLLAMCNAFIVPHEDADELDTCPVGTGPFYWMGKNGDTLCLNANNEYYQGRPWLDRIEFPVITDENRRFSDFMAGQLSQVDVPDSIYKRVKQDAILSPNLVETNLWGINYLGFNLNEKPFDNLALRKALNYAVDRENIVKLVLNGRAQVAKGILPPGISGYNEELVGYEYDIEKAKKYLEEAGYPNGKGLPQITLKYNKDPIHTRTAEFIQANFRDIGVECKLKGLEFGEHLADIESGKTSFFRMGWTVDYPDPDALLHTMFHSSNIKVAYNFTRFNNAEFDKILDLARFETEQDERAKLYKKAEKYVVEEAPCIFMYFYTLNVLLKPQVRGFSIGPMGESVVEYRHLWLTSASQE